MSSYSPKPNLIELLKLGKKYQSVCPKNAYLVSLLVDVKFNFLYSMLIKSIPPIIFFNILWTYFVHQNYVLLIISSFFIITLPLHCILWFGKRAKSPLPLALLGWFGDIKKALIMDKVIDEKTHYPLDYYNLMFLYSLLMKHCTTKPKKNKDESL